MMYFILLFIFSWIAWTLKADKSRVRELFGVSIFSSFLGLFTDLVMVEYNLWSYKGLPDPLYTIPLTLDFGIYPVVAYLFMQNCPKPYLQLLKRSILWMVFAMLLEWFTMKTGHMDHHKWWSLWLSAISDILIFHMLVGFYRAYQNKKSYPLG